VGPRASAAAALPEDSDKPIRDHLARVLGSVTFQPVDRLKRFLAFIAHEALAGRSDQLKEYVIGVQVFGKEESFDPRTDPIQLADHGVPRSRVRSDPPQGRSALRPAQRRQAIRIHRTAAGR
jgi:hypothetical protein